MQWTGLFLTGARCAVHMQGACLSADATPSGDWLVAGCHDASVHIFHFKRREQEGVDVEVRGSGGVGEWVSGVGGCLRYARVMGAGTTPGVLG